MSAEWSAVEGDAEDGDELVELRDLSSRPDDAAEEIDGLGFDSGNGSTEGRVRTVTIEEKEERPIVHQLLNSLCIAKQPGLFACGPALLMQTIRATTKEICLVRCRHLETLKYRCMKRHLKFRIALRNAHFIE
jgi:hypothetical protein